jgi:hypothetical protein
MTAAQALAKARAILGPTAAIFVNERALVGEMREAALQVRAEVDAATKAKNARFVEILAADAEYQRLVDACADAERREVRMLAARMPSPHQRRVLIGTASEPSLQRVVVNKVLKTVFKEVCAGDNFTEAIEVLRSRREAA